MNELVGNKRNIKIKNYNADAGIRVALIRVSVTVAWLTEAKVDALNGARKSGIAIFARETLVPARTRALFDCQSSFLARVALFSNVK